MVQTACTIVPSKNKIIHSFQTKRITCFVGTEFLNITYIYLCFLEIIIIIIIIITIRATGTISKSFRKYVNNIPGKHEVKELQKTAKLGPEHIRRKVLM